ncbi:hypothetical protein [Glutamicibacter sp. TV12E]|uniref:hypothetical protein n=1 Tax=Glutamicibacter sp. TV12E TaxID=3446362 RepID=UPI0040336304
MKQIPRTATTFLIAIALVAGSAGTALADPADRNSLEPLTAENPEPQTAETKASLDYVQKTRKPTAVRKTTSGVERDYEFSKGSTFTIIERRSKLNVANPALGAGQDSTGFYIDMSPADQRSFINGGSALILASIGALMGPFAIAVLPILGSYITPQVEGLTCANDNRTMRFYYTLDGNAVSSRCL